MDWRLIFKKSAFIYGGEYDEKDLVQRVFRPVTDSWFQKRLEHVRNELKKEMLLEPSCSTKDH